MHLDAKDNTTIAPPSNPKSSSWTFLTNHTHVLLCLATNPSMRMRDIAHQVGLTERAVQRLISELHQGGYITLTRQGRCNRYRVNTEKHLKHPIEAQRCLGDLVKLILN